MYTPIDEKIDELGHYEIASGHPSQKYRVVFVLTANPFRHHELVGKGGNIVLFKTMEAAKKRADKLNESFLTAI